jgi:hypothetical protein
LGDGECQLIIWVDDGLFDGTKSDIDLLSLFRQAAQRRHTLVVSTSPSQMWNGTMPNFLNWQKLNLTDKLRREVSFLLERLRMISSNLVTRGKAKPIWVTKQVFPNANSCILDLEQAIRAVALPLHVLIENQINDAAFLRTVMPIAWQTKLKEWEKSGELRYVQAGGITEMRRLFEFHIQDDCARKTFGLPASVWILTHFLIYDHDGKSKLVPGEGTKALEKVIKKTSIAHHRLWRRTQENYLPINSLLEIIKDRITSQAQKDAFTDAVICHKMFQPSAEGRHYAELPRLGDDAYFKNEFTRQNNDRIWNSNDFEADGIWPEMTLLAEAIAAVI